MNMNILHILQGFSLGGASRSVVAIAKDSHVKKRDRVHRTISITPAQPEAVKLAEAAGMRVIQKPKLEQITSEIEWADIVHFHFWNSPELYEFLQLDLPEMRSLVWLKVVGDRAPHVVTKEWIDYSDILLATTPRTLDLPAIQSRPDLLQNNRIGVVPGIADFSRLESLKPRPHSTFNVGYIGTVDFSKLYQNYVPMSAGIEVPDIRFIVCGGGIENHLKQQANHLGVAEKFEFRGYVEDIRSVLEILDVFGYPLVEDTYATSEKSLQEAMYAGVPPVVFPHGGVKHLVIHNHTGLVVESEREYREAIAYLYHNPDERMRLGNNAREYARRHFDPEVSIENINQTYDRLIEFPKRKRRLFAGEYKTGSELFVESLGDAAPQFKASLTSDNLSEQLEGDRRIATASPGLCNPGGGGLFHYRSCHPQDGYLRLWSGLVLQQQGRHQEAVSEFSQAWQNGCQIGRVLWYLANAAEQIGNLNLAQKALNKVSELMPNFAPAEQMKNRIDGLSSPASTSRVNQAQLNLQRQFWNVNSMEEAMFSRVLAYPGIEKLSLPEKRKIWEESISRTTQQILQGIPSQADWNVLEIGCGVGRLVKHLRERFCRVDGVDISANMIEFAKQYLADGQSNGELYVNNGCNLQGLPGQFYDFVYSTIVFQHIRSLSVVKSYFDEIFRVLKPGGYFRVQVHDRSAENSGNFDEEGDENQQYYFSGNAYTDTQLRDLLIESGFDLISLEWTQPWIWSTVRRPQPNVRLPKVSAIVSTYNSEKFLRGCLEDLTDQTLYQNGELEIIVIDSKSEQNEKQIVSEFQSQYPRIIYHQTESRETLYAAWNRAIALAKGDYITNANTDDRRRQDASEVMAEYLDKNPDVAVVYGDQLITQNENETFDNTQANRRWNWPEFSYEELERRCILGPQPMWRKSLHEKYGNFREELQVAGDYEFWLRVGKTEKIVKLPQVFGLYYEHPRGLEKSSPTMVREVRQIWQEYGISQRGIQPKTSVPVPVSPTELDSMREGTPTTPQISIIIPCYNQANYLKEAVDSLLTQTIADWECIIVNDGSSDGTPVVASLLIELHRDRTLKLINQENKGVVAARNVGLSQARGNYLLFLDADDKLHPNFLAETLEILNQKPDVGFVYTDIEYFGTQQGVKTDGDFDPSRLLRSNQASITSLFRRSICDRIGGFKTEMEAGLEDWEFWVAAYESGWPGYRLPKPYLYYRQYADGSRLQKLLGDRETLAVQKAKIIALHPNLYTPEEVGPAAQILQDRGIVIHPVRSAANIVSNPEQFLADVTDLVSRYNRGSGDRTGLDKLRQLRRELAEFWSNCEPESLQSHYTGAPGKAQKLLLKSGIKHEVKTESEINDSRTLQTAIADNYSHGTAIATMLYFWPHQLSIPYEKLALPQWLAADYLDFLLSNPEFFQEVGEADRYRQYFLGLLRYLHRSIFDNQDSQNWKNIAWFVTTHCRVISLYFNTENLKEIYTLRGDIIEFALRSRGAQIDWDIPRRSPERQKIRVGILSKHFGPMTETFATLPAFEYLHREQFEVVLYALQTDGNSVEQYCRDRADRFVHLSGSLMAQVNAIRGDELDVLLVGTNVTAVTHEITLIACHRLARVQLTCFNSPVTTGFKNIDFYIAGELMELPKNGGDHYREKLVKIPGAGCCFSYTVEPQKTAPPPQRQQLGIPDDAIAFMSGANLYKLTPELRETWAKILVAVPHSNLVVLPFGASWTSQYPEVAFREQMQALFNRHNIDPKRLKILGALPNRAQVKAVLQLGDIYLDSFPYAGTTSLVDPLEVGLPVVVWEGNTLRSRMGAAMVRSLLPNEAIPASEQAYIDAAVQLAADVGGRQRKSQEIRKQMAANPEFLDSRNYAVKMGAVFAQLFQLRRRQEEAIALENPAVRQQFLAELVDRVNLYDLDPTNADVVEKLRHTRRVMAEYWLNQPPEKLETLYQQPVGKGYQILLNRGIQKEPLTDSEQVLVNQLAKVATGLAQPNSINCLMVVMLYSQPGKMFVRDASRRLPGWLYSDYQRIFENSEAIAQIQRAAAGQPPTPQKVEELAPEAIQFDNPQSINRAIGCAKLFQIDPTDADIAAELRQLRWQMAHFWLNLPEEILKETYDRDIGDAFRSLLHSRLQNERLTQQEWDFLQTLATYLRQGLDAPRSIHYLMAAMLYYRPEQVQIQNPSRLPDRLRRDYESWQNSTSE